MIALALISARVILFMHILCHIDFATDDGLYFELSVLGEKLVHVGFRVGVFYGFFDEVERAVHIAVICYRDRGHTEFVATTKNIAESYRSVEHTVLGMQMQVDEFSVFFFIFNFFSGLVFQNLFLLIRGNICTECDIF